MSGRRSYERLLEPGRIGQVKTRNRIIKTGASMCYWHENDLHMSAKAKAYYEALARGGVGLLIIESPTIDYPTGARWRERYRMDDDRYIQGMSELVEVIHKHGCPTFMQMWHDGPWQNPLFAPPATFDGPPIGASPVNLDTPGDFHRDVPRELTVPEIEAIEDKFASAAVRARKAGFDGIDINAASSHIMHNFLSPFWNRRKDAYGGTTENRARLLVQTIKKIKKGAGNDFPVSVIINGMEVGRCIGIKDEDCLTADESRKVARLLQEVGADAIMVRSQWLGYHVGGFFTDYLYYPEPPIPYDSFPEEYYWKKHGAGATMLLTRAMKRTVSIPVAIVGKVSPELGERLLREGKADFIGMTRALQADPDLPKKLAAGRPEEIAPCTACATCLDQSVSMARRCRINAAMGTECYTVEKAAKRKKVVVIGGGPAGMEAARVAALRGHDVTLYEKSDSLGGLLPLAALIKGHEPEDLPPMISYFTTQLKKLGVKTKLGTAARESIIKATAPDAIVVATGGLLTAPAVSTANKKKVITTPTLHARVKPFLKVFGPRIMETLTRFWMPVGEKVVIIGGELHGCEVAEFLAKRGKKVTVVAVEGEVLGKGVLDLRLGLLLDWFRKKGVDIITDVQSVRVVDEGLVITKDGKEQTIEADSILPTSPLKADKSLFESLKGAAAEVYAVGDCAEPRMIVDAIADGWRVGQQI